MKYTKYLFAMLAAAGTLLSCQNDEKLLGEEACNGVKFTATTECYDQGTRTSMNSYGNVVWKLGDKMTIFTGSTINEQYKVSDNSDGKTTADIQKVSVSSFVAGQEIPANVAFYPYSESTTVEQYNNGYRLSVVLPERQNYAANSFGNGSFPMVAVTDGTSDKALKFYNLMGGLKLQLKGTCKVQTITLTGNNGEILYGPATITAQSGAAPVTQLTGTTQKTVTLNCGGVQLNSSTATTFIIAVPAGALSSGFKVVITDTEGKVMEKSTTASNTIVRSKLTTMPAFTVETVAVTPSTHEYVDLGLPSGNLWAKMNLGASSDTEYGTRYAWGEVETKSSFSWSTYKGYSYKASWKEPDTYDNDGFKIADGITHPAEYTYPDYGSEICGTVYDAVLTAWGGYWHIPSDVDWQELLDNCTWESANKSGVNGYKITSKTNSNWIFIPSTELWTSTLSCDKESAAKHISGNSISTTDRYYGYRIRPVYNDKITKIALNKNIIEGVNGHTEQLIPSFYPANSPEDRSVVWYSNNESSVTVDQSGNVTITGNTHGIVTVKLQNTIAQCDVQQITLSNGHYFVDLGLSVKWATMNVGAATETGYGDYFAWGATEPLYEPGYAQEAPQSHWKAGKSAGYTYVNTPYQTANATYYDETKWTKYLGSTTSSYKDASATDANALKTVLDASDDAASVNWGGSWRMPTKAEQDELSNTSNCTWTWYESGNTEFNGIAGYKVTSKKSGYSGNYIFLPAAGYRSVTNLYSVGSYGCYWSSSLDTSYPYSAYELNFSSGGFNAVSHGRYCGQSVRPVCQ